MRGDVDPLMPVGNGMRLARRIPEARYLELAGVGHIVPLEGGDRLAEVVEEAGATTRSGGSGQQLADGGGLEPD
jgi:pimeloyl-ACP methyl ester carboxylesterase